MIWGKMSVHKHPRLLFISSLIFCRPPKNILNPLAQEPAASELSPNYAQLGKLEQNMAIIWNLKEANKFWLFYIFQIAVFSYSPLFFARDSILENNTLAQVTDKETHTHARYKKKCKWDSGIKKSQLSPAWMQIMTFSEVFERRDQMFRGPLFSMDIKSST